MSRSSFWRSGVEMIPQFLSPADCSGLLSAVDSYCETHTVPLIVRPQRHRSLEYQVIDGEHFHSAFANATDLLSQAHARVQQVCGCEPTFIDDSRAVCNVNITPPGGQYLWHYDRNLVTAVIYLNEVGGGETELYPNRRVLFPAGSLAALQPVVDKLILSATALYPNPWPDDRYPDDRRHARAFAATERRTASGRCLADSDGSPSFWRSINRMPVTPARPWTSSCIRPCPVKPGNLFHSYRCDPSASALAPGVANCGGNTGKGDEMPGLVRKSLDAPEETRLFEDGSGQLELVNVDAGAVGRATFQPGWQWSKHVKPIAKTDSCQAAHMGYFVSGRMKVVMDDGEEIEYGPGDFAVMAPGHDAWVLGDEPCVVIDWQGFADYAKR